MDKRLNIAFVWHMHQPLYKDPFTGEYTLPWVLFHGTKDYYDMVSILDEFPEVHQTFNLVPCLIEQINEYGSNKASDRYRKLSMKAASELTKEDKSFMLRFFFQASWENMIKPVARYWELLRKRGLSNSREDIQAVLRYFTEQDYLDLQVLFNLVWIDPEIRRKDEFLSFLMKKGEKFTEDEKHRLLNKQIEIINLILPKYAEMMDKGIIEVSTSPYYHPILPLLCDSFSAKEAMPWVELPKERFIHPEDASVQLTKGVELYRDTFGEDPAGLWPSEGSVSMDMLPLVKNAGIKWLATDEEILSNSLRRPLRRDTVGNCYDTFLYKPYSIDAGGDKLSVVFRDHVLSDLIGFDYCKMGADHAADDFMTRLTHIYNLMEKPEDHIVSIILDGENAWESFRNDGRDFFVALYTRLTKHHRFRCVTVNEFLKGNPYRENLPKIYSGSWINHNFKIWIGHQEDNTAWDYIAEVRDALVKYEEAVKETPGYEEKKEDIEEAWKGVYAAEGSDWFWWYGEEHSSLSDEHFDSLFRRHIKKIYTLIGQEPPDYLDIPIMSEVKGFKPAVPQSAFIKPVIDGEISNYFEWLSAGSLQRVYFGTAMHRELQSKGLIEGIYYGFSPDTLYFRFDYYRDLMPFEKEWTFQIGFLHPKHVRVSATVKGKLATASVSVKPSGKDKWTEPEALASIASDRVVEIGIPLDALGIKKGEEIRLVINIDAGENGIERWPSNGFLVLEIPTEDFERQNWIV